MRADWSLSDQLAAPAGRRLGRLLPGEGAAGGHGPRPGEIAGAGVAGPPWLRAGAAAAARDLLDFAPDDPGAHATDAAATDADDPDALPDAGGSAGGLGRLVGSAFDPGRPGLRALAAVAAVVVLAAAALAWWSRPQPEPVTPQLVSTAPVRLSPTAPAQLVVAVTGDVHAPGLVHLPPGARVADAIEAAGGLLPEAEVDHLNLARKLTDGELIAVGVEPPPAELAGVPGVPGGLPAGGKINLNTASSEQLQALPGIGPALAQRIIDFRTTHGPFTSVGQLREVSGIGETRFAELRELVTV